LVINKLECSLAGKSEAVAIVPGTLAHRAYGRMEAVEQFACSYGLNPAYRKRIAQDGLQISGTDAAGEARIVELLGHPFFVATLFLPQLSSTPGQPHPLIAAYLRAAQGLRELGEIAEPP
jgi:CTP synthase (UTP-ammonia lyase)